MGKHLNRQELIQAARTEDLSSFHHLTECSECRDAVSLLKTYDVAGSTLLSNAPKAVLDRAKEIAIIPQRKEGLSNLVAKLIFDSWAEPVPIGVRGEALVVERRLRFEAEGIIFDLRAERQSGRWSFVGGVIGKVPDSSDILLKVGGRRIRPDVSGLFHWESVHPPKVLKVLFNDLTAVNLPELSWRRKPSR